MTVQRSDKLVIRDYPLALWLAAGVFLATGLLVVIQSETSRVAGVVASLISAAIMMLPTVLTVTADRQRGSLTVRHQSLWRNSVKEYPLTDIASVAVVRSSSTSYGSSSTTYRLTLALASGEEVPLRSYYSGGYSRKAKIARQLSDFLGLADPETQPVFPLAGLLGNAAALMMPAGATQEGTTDGVTWQVGTSGVSAMALRRWMSPDFKLPGQFVCLLQKPRGSASLGGKGGLGGMVGHMVFQQIFNLYGVGADDLPGLSTSAPVQGLDPRMAEQFASLTSDQAGAQQVLNAWAVTPLIDWAERYPLKSVQSAGAAGQLVVLFSPQGVCLTCLNMTASDQVEALTQLGVDLVRAQGAPRPAA